tara:strand:- start:410 stop:832 length:423 start_codon:yes stop_codon:yes gene_type:complete
MIVEANRQHLSQILEIESDSFESPWSSQSFLSEIKSQVGSNWVFMNKSELLGYMFGWIVCNDYHINNIAVRSSDRRKGVAKKMIDNIIFNTQIKNIYLEVSRLNCKAINLYEKIGFVQNGLRKKYYNNGSDAILYKMEIK